MCVCVALSMCGFSNSGVEQAIGCYDTPVQVCVILQSLFFFLFFSCLSLKGSLIFLSSVTLKLVVRYLNRGFEVCSFYKFGIV